MAKFAKVEDGGIVKIGHPGGGDQRVDDGGWITPVDGVWSPDDLAATGWVEIVEEPRPEHDSATSFVQRDAPVANPDGTVTQGWLVQGRSPEDIERAARETAAAGRDAALLAKAEGLEALTDEELRELVRQFAVQLLLGL